MFSKLISNLSDPVHHLVAPTLAAEDWRVFAILAAFPLLLAVESFQARREGRPREYRRSYLANLGTLVANDTLLSLLGIPALWLVADQFARYGLLAGVDDPVVRAVAGFVLLDLVLYFWHRANHRFESLWRFHKVHHSDRVMNVTTAFRLHIVEVVLTMLVKSLFIVLLGVPAAVVLVSETIVTVFIMFHHTNFSFRGERWLGWLTIMPFLHRVHHSTRRSEHDSNYGAVFSLWDRLFGTFRDLVPAEIGLRHVPSLNVLELLKYGFGRQMVPNTPVLRQMIAEAAYYRAEKRGFAPGQEWIDWIEAEREIRGC